MMRSHIPTLPNGISTRDSGARSVNASTTSGAVSCPRFAEVDRGWSGYPLPGQLWRK